MAGRAVAAPLDGAPPQLAVHLQQERQERHQARPPAAHYRAQQLQTIYRLAYTFPSSLGEQTLLYLASFILEDSFKEQSPLT